MEFSQQFFAQHEDPMFAMYTQPHFQSPQSAFQEEGLGAITEPSQDPTVISTHPMQQRPIIPSLEEAAEAEDSSTRPRLTQEQIAVLEDNFKSKPKPGTDFKKQLATRIGLSLQRVNNWYQNRRAKARHQRPQEHRFDVFPNDPSTLWSSVDLGYSDYPSGPLDLSPQVSPPFAHPPSVDYISIPVLDETPHVTSNFNVDLDVFHGCSDSSAADHELSPNSNMSASLVFSDAENLVMTKALTQPTPDWSLQDWQSEIQSGMHFPDEGLSALQESQNTFSQAMYQSLAEGYHVGNPSCQTFTTNSSSDGEQLSLLTPPPRTSPLPFVPHDNHDRRESVTADLASDFNTFHLQQSRSSLGFHNELSDVATMSTPFAAHGTPPTPPELRIDATAMQSDSAAASSMSCTGVPRLDIASRRKRPRPADLRPEAQRSVSYGPMTLSPTARAAGYGLAKTASVRRIKSTGNGLNIGNGRIQKPGTGHAPMSPRNFQSLSNSDLLGQSAYVTNASSRNITPLTPLSPMGNAQESRTWSSHWPHVQDHATPTALDPEAHINSRPITPYETSFPPSYAQAMANTSYHWPPQSAPPQQTTFFDSPPMPSTNFNHLSWQTPSNFSLQGEPPQQIVRPPLIPQYPYVDIHTLPSQTQQIYPQMGFYQPAFISSSPPHKEIEIQVQVIPAPEGLPQGRKTYTFNHTTPKDFSDAEGTSGKVAGTTDPNP
ncbi:MAG: hypothetical protein Q9220_003416 [cf. Caloplaca sp. 1 TL-2023]